MSQPISSISARCDGETMDANDTALRVLDLLNQAAAILDAHLLGPIDASSPREVRNEMLRRLRSRGDWFPAILPES